MKVYREETFGPVLPLVRFKSEEEAIEIANDTEYGLSASVWSKDLARANRVADAIVTGNVSINNVMITEGNHALPFGGVKNSGFGRFKGEFGLVSFSNVKSVMIEPNSKKIEANWYPYTPEKYAKFTDLIRAVFGGGGIIGFVKFAIAGLKLESYVAKVRKDPV
jgi:delta 1-pyrroline-5-carboxylate dehydrogenase